MSFLLRSDLPLRKLCYLFLLLSCFYFNDPAATEIYTLSLHDALPISWPGQPELLERIETVSQRTRGRQPRNVDDLLAVRDDNALANAIPALSLSEDRKSTRLNSSHVAISYAVFCLKKKTMQTL